MNIPPQKTSLTPPLYPTGPQQPSQPPQYSQDFDQLRKQNLFLKQQLSAFLKTQPQQNIFQPQTHIRNNFDKQNSAYDVQSNFKNKMSKLKNRSSNRKSIQHQQISILNSPRQSPQKQTAPIHNQLQQTFSHPICNQKNYQSPFKMIIKQDQNGRLYRDVSKDNLTTRNTITSPRYTHRQSMPVFRHPPPSPHQNKMVNVQTKVKGHLRYQSSFDKEKDNTFQKITKQYQQAAKSQKRVYTQQQTINNKYKNTYKSPKAQIVSPEPHPITPLTHQPRKTQVKQNIKPIHSPRYHAYIQKLDAQEKISMSKSPQEQFSNNGDSILSIENTIRKKKIERKLKYDIYLADDI